MSGKQSNNTFLDKQGNLNFKVDNESESEDEETYTFNKEIVFDSADEDDYFNVVENVVEQDESSSEEFINPETVVPIETLTKEQSEPPMEQLEDVEVIEDEITFEELYENIVIIEDALIPEDKVIATDNQQSDDLFNQLIKNSKELDDKIISHNKKILKNFEYLKKMHSNFGDDNNIIAPKINGDIFKPYNKILNSKMFYPIVNEKKQVFNINISEEEEEVLEEGGLSFNKYFSDLQEINADYKTGSKRFEYSFYNHINQIYSHLDGYDKNNAEGFPQILKNDREMFSNTFNDEIMTYGGQLPNLNKHRLLGPTIFKGKEYIKGSLISLAGYLQKPRSSKVFSHLYKNNDSLYEVMKNNNADELTEVDYDAINKVKIKSQLQIGDLVYLCEDRSTEGSIIKEIKENGNIVVGNKELDVRKISVIPCNSFDNLNAFIFTNTENKNILDYLDIITPSTKNILESYENENVNSIISVQRFLNKYNLDLEDVSSNNLKTIIKTIHKNNKNLDKYNVNYNKYNKTTDKNNRSNYNFLNNKTLDELREFYGQYPLFNSPHDSEEERYKFVVGQSDKGLLYFKTMVSRIENILYGSEGAKNDKINKLMDIIDNLKSNKSELEADNSRINSEEDACAKNKLKKVYYSLYDLENDANKKVLIDNDRLVHGDSETYIMDGDYGMVVYPNDMNKLYVWDKTEWRVVNDKMDIEMSKDKNLCNLSGVNVNDLDNNRSLTLCKYSKKYGKCFSIKYLDNLDKLDNIVNQLKYNYTLLKQLKNLDSYLEKQKQNIQNLKEDLQLEFSKKIRIENHFAKLYKKIKDDVEDIHTDFYDKINKYLENISLLSSMNYYKALKILFKKYGRSAFEDENENNTYSILGTKVLFCNHHKIFIDYYDDLIKSEELLEKVNSKYGVTHEGYVWCNNCGQVLNMDEYETVEGFNKDGAHDVTHEKITDETPDTSDETNEMIKSLQNIIFEGDEKSIKNSENKLSVVKIIDVICSIMGIKLNNDDRITAIKQAHTVCKNNIRSKTSYIEVAKKQRKLTYKALESAYTTFYNRNCIVYTVATLFMIIQSAIPSYTNLNNHKKCNPSLGGFPLEKSNKRVGIDYIVCILDTLKTTGSEWRYIRNINVKEQLLVAINLFIKDDIYQYLYEKKRKYNDTNTIQKEITTTVNWDYFKPSFVKNDFKLDNISLENIRPNTEHKLVLKFIELLNKSVAKSDVENAKYIPMPVDNQCCLEDITNNNYLNYFFKKDAKLETVYNNLVKIDAMKKNFTMKFLKVSNKPNPKKKIESFVNILFDEANISEEYINNYFLTYISEGPYKGQKYIFNDDGLCQLSGLHIENIKKIEHSKKDMMELIKYIQKSNQFRLNASTLEYTSIKLNKLLEENVILKNDKFLVDINGYISSGKNDEILNLLVNEIKIQTEKLVYLLDSKIRIDKKKLSDLLLGLGELKDNGDNTIDFFTKKSQLIGMYLVNYIKIPINLINNKYDFRFDEVIDEKKRDDTYKTYSSEFRFLSEFVFVESDIIQNALNILKSSTKNINKLKGSQIVGYILQYIFIYILNKICETESDNIDLNKELEELDDIEDLDITRDIEKKQYVVLKLIYKLLENIGTKQKLFEKHTKTYIQSVIEKKSENDKESNLKFIQELDRETWGSLKNMITLGMDTWKNLSSKSKYIYITNNINSDNLQTPQETQYELQNKALSELGQNYTMDEYNQWLEGHEATNRENALAYQERDIMEDDDE